MKQFLLILALIASFPAATLAANTPKKQRQIESLGFMVGRMVPDPDKPGEMKYEPPAEPTIPKVKYLKQDPPSSLRDRVDRLLYGIKVDIPPEYDVYGYEIRRYMAHIAGPEVIGNPERVKQELQNVANAKIVFKYWRDEMIKEIAAIEKQIEAENASSDDRSRFKYNSGVAMAFMSECAAWIEADLKMLEFLADHEGQYTFDSPRFTFLDDGDRRAFLPLYMAALQAHKYIVEYMPFTIMVY